jgi:hypothetical protein
MDPVRRWTARVLWPVSLWLIVLMLSPTVRAQDAVDLPEAALRQIAASQAEKAARTAAQRKIASALLFATRLREGRQRPEEAQRVPPPLDVDDTNRVLVDIVSANTTATRGAVIGSGGSEVDEIPQFRSLRVRLPFASLEIIAARPEVERIRPASQEIVRKVNTSQGDQAHRAVQARSIGATGAGVGIGVVSNGVTTLALRQASGDLPAVTVLPGQAGAGDEGTAMLEIVYDLAPAATLFFARSGGSPAIMAANIIALCNAGARVIVDDIGYPDEPVFEDGTIAQAVNTVTANGCHYFSAAGNEGNLNDLTSGVWEGDFIDGGSGIHSFGGGLLSNLITADPAASLGGSPGFMLQWSDKWGASSNDYDLFLLSGDLSTVIASSTDDQLLTGDPFEYIPDPVDHSGLRLVIVRYAGAGRFLHLNTLRGRLSVRTAGQIFGHPSAALAYAVAAVNVATAGGGAFVGGAVNPAETFSSDGPRRIFYAANGTSITPGNFSSTGGTVRPKPDLAAADGVATSTPGFNPFFGTSAAAPHAAAIAGLVLQAAGGPNSLSVSALRNVLFGATLDIEATGVDRDSGYGILDAYRAVITVQPFEDDPLVPGVHTARAVHVTQLRGKIDAARVRYGLAAFTWTDPTIVPGVTTILAGHVQEMRTALSQAYVASGRAAPSFTDPSLVGAVIRAVHISELRAAVNALQ